MDFQASAENSNNLMWAKKKYEEFQRNNENLEQKMREKTCENILRMQSGI